MKKKGIIFLLAVCMICSCGKKEKTEEKETTKIYYIDNESGELKSEEAEMAKVDEVTVWSLLREKEIVPEDAQVLSLKKEGEILYLDVNEAFGNYLRQMGTTGEHEILMCVVNSYLDAFQCEKMKITEEGMALASSHKIYEEYLTKME